MGTTIEKTLLRDTATHIKYSEWRLIFYFYFVEIVYCVVLINCVQCTDFQYGSAMFYARSSIQNISVRCARIASVASPSTSRLRVVLNVNPLTASCVRCS